MLILPSSHPRILPSSPFNYSNLQTFKLSNPRFSFFHSIPQSLHPSLNNSQRAPSHSHTVEIKPSILKISSSHLLILASSPLPLFDLKKAFDIQTSPFHPLQQSNRPIVQPSKSPTVQKSNLQTFDFPLFSPSPLPLTISKTFSGHFLLGSKKMLSIKLWDRKNGKNTKS